MKRFKHGLMAVVAVASIGLAGFFWFQIRQDAMASALQPVTALLPGDGELGQITFVAPGQAADDSRLLGLTARADGARLLWSASPDETILEAGFADTKTMVISATSSQGYRVFAIDLDTHSINRELNSLTPKIASGHRQMLANADRFCDSEPNERGVMDVFCYDASWRNPKRLTMHDGPEDLIEPAISPDGAWVVFEVSTKRMRHTVTTPGDTIWRIGLNGANLQQLTRGADDRNPTWSDDGGHIYFQRRMPDGNWDMYAMGSDGNNANPILRTFDQDERWVNRIPGKTAVIASVGPRIKKIDLDTKAGEWLTGGVAGPETHVSVSPDAKLFSFVADSGVWVKTIE